MTPRRLLPLYGVLVLLAVAMLLTLPFILNERPAATPVASNANSEGPTTRRARSGNPLANPPGMVDRLVFTQSADAFRKGALKNTTVRDADGHVLLSPNPDPDRFPYQGSWTSPEVTTEYPFTELLPSWNLTAPDETGVYFEVRARDLDSREWSPWLYIGYWGKTRPRTKLQEFDYGTINQDNLTLSRPADAYQIRATFQSFDASHPDLSPDLRRVTMCYSGVVADEARYAQLVQSPVPTLPSPATQPTAGLDIPVPYRPQGDSTKALAGQICSPTSTSMVLQYLGVNRPTVQNALAIYDEDNAMFGNWNRAVAYAGSLGIDSYLTRFRNWDQVVSVVTAGQPLICSIRAKKGDFQHPSIYDSTGGHLIVVRGITPDGDAIVNDPANRAKGNGFVYHKDDMTRVWLSHGGVAYILQKPTTASPTTHPTVAASAH